MVAGIAGSKSESKPQRPISFEEPLKRCDNRKEITPIDRKAMDRVFQSTMRSAAPPAKKISFFRAVWNGFVRIVTTICEIIKLVFDWVVRKVAEAFGCRKKEEKISAGESAADLFAAGDDDAEVSPENKDKKPDPVPEPLPQPQPAPTIAPGGGSAPAQPQPQPAAPVAVIEQPQLPAPNAQPVEPVVPIVVDQPTLPQPAAPVAAPVVPIIVAADQPQPPPQPNAQPAPAQTPAAPAATPLVVAPKPNKFLALSLNKDLVDQLVMTLSNPKAPKLGDKGSLWGLMGIEDELKKIHPLRFIAYIVSSSKLRQALKTMQDPEMPKIAPSKKEFLKEVPRWNVFVTGFAKNVMLHAMETNIGKYRREFARHLGLDEGLVIGKMDELCKLSEKVRELSHKKARELLNGSSQLEAEDVKNYGAFINYLCKQCSARSEHKEHKGS